MYYKQSATNEQTARFLAILGKGIENARTTTELSQELGITTRTLNGIVETCRRKGILICGDRRNGKGLFLATTFSEGSESIATLRAQANSLNETANAMQKALDEKLASSKQLDILNELRNCHDDEDESKRDS